MAEKILEPNAQMISTLQRTKSLVNILFIIAIALILVCGYLVYQGLTTQTNIEGMVHDAVADEIGQLGIFGDISSLGSLDKERTKHVQVAPSDGVIIFTVRGKGFGKCWINDKTIDWDNTEPVDAIARIYVVSATSGFIPIKKGMNFMCYIRDSIDPNDTSAVNTSASIRLLPFKPSLPSTQ